MYAVGEDFIFVNFRKNITVENTRFFYNQMVSLIHQRYIVKYKNSKQVKQLPMLKKSYVTVIVCLRSNIKYKIIIFFTFF